MDQISTFSSALSGLVIDSLDCGLPFLINLYIASRTLECDYLSGDLKIKGLNIIKTLGGIIPCHIISRTGD